ncbi:hypothetical protein CALCODRAFT_503519 [Calocera cornea HHB12733]|uniref:Uncharacterized protein n=1 Tax=Calocera cornea HHB12733 TaxID=1353952 RepID=A0A165CV76_9BASI|nr:hypothetical protein CALCODRAFT_503519 [Calocera cornea HHB12733]
MSIQPYNISLGSESPTFQYVPIRDGPVTAGWNSSYSGNIEWNGLEGSQGVGTPYRRTQLNDASFSLDFQGSLKRLPSCSSAYTRSKEWLSTCVWVRSAELVIP